MNKNFIDKYKFTILLLAVMITAAVLVLLFDNSTIAGVPDFVGFNILILLLVGFCAGLLGGWIGTGGCSVMLPVLHFWIGFPAPIAVGTTLFAVIFTAVSGGYGHLKQKNLDKRATMWVGGTGIIGVLIGSWLFTFLSNRSLLLGLIIGLVFLWPSIRMIWEGIKGYIKKSRAVKNNSHLINCTIVGKPVAFSVFGTIVGTFTGIVGLGGGYALVPGFIYLFGAEVYVTMGTSLAVMIPMALVGGVIKLLQGYVLLSAALVLATGTIVGAQIGAATIKKFKPNTLKLIFGIYFLYVAVKFITNYFGVNIW